MSGRRGLGARARSVAALLALAPGLRAQLEGAQVRPLDAPEWLADASIGPDALRSAVEESLPGALPALLAFVSGADHEVGEPVATERRIAVHEALAGVPLRTLASGLAPLLEPAWAEDFDDPMRVEALTLLAGGAGSAELNLLARIAQPPAVPDGVEQLRGAAVRAAYEDALVALLVREPADSEEIWHKFPWLPDALRPAVLRALARAGGDDTLERMAEELGTHPELAAFLLPELETAARRLPVDLQDGLGHVRECLDSEEPTVVAAALPLVVVFADAASCPILVRLLESEDDSLRENARRALVDLTGRAGGQRPADWRIVLAAEERWWTEEGAKVSGTIVTAEAADVPALLARLAARPLHARALGPCLEELLRRREPSIAALACATIARLRVRAAAEELLAVALEHAHAEVRAAAQHALRVLAPKFVLPPQDERHL